MTYFLGIDIGTFESKGAIVDDGGNIVATAARPHRMLVPQPGWAEHRPKQDWWGDFCFISKKMLADSGINPTAIKAAGDAFNTTPGKAGAGPFMLKSVKPGESMVFEKNPDYYGGQVLLDSITFVPETSGAASAYEALKAGTLDAAFLRAPDTIKRARDEGTDTVLAERIPA